MRALLAALVMLLLAAAPARAQAPPDPGSWDQLLQRYVATGADGINRVAYARWKTDSADRAALRGYIATLEATPASRLPRADQFVFWVNLYNAVTVDVVLGAYPVRSIRDIKPNPFASGPWSEKRVTVEGRRLSLDDIEHRVLRPGWRDPRVHYALNCASLGCPNLMPRAWRGETLGPDLDAAARAYVGHARGVAAGARGLTLSRLYQWYRADFGDEAALRAHLVRYAPAARRADIASRPILGYAYDWSLNDAAR
jgi:Protein of unknown function, DUF547